MNRSLLEMQRTIASGRGDEDTRWPCWGIHPTAWQHPTEPSGVFDGLLASLLGTRTLLMVQPVSQMFPCPARYEIDEPMALYGAIPIIWAIHRLGGWAQAG